MTRHTARLPTLKHTGGSTVPISCAKMKTNGHRKLLKMNDQRGRKGTFGAICENQVCILRERSPREEVLHTLLLVHCQLQWAILTTSCSLGLQAGERVNNASPIILAEVVEGVLTYSGAPTGTRRL
ncbi:hypothetical protein EVAR_77984_1 [Eumeta japonica]|uniref:Uncharacterized protein n=1 Tax=Eumeta variegata TaxID=151549 RepID=A0A4C1T2W2_EUMVA|nr:hypothetical protein EVAR_77984_1 [Eumeta japonica]